jgi:hypothetical protein
VLEYFARAAAKCRRERVTVQYSKVEPFIAYGGTLPYLIYFLVISWRGLLLRYRTSCAARQARMKYTLPMVNCFPTNTQNCMQAYEIFENLCVWLAHGARRVSTRCNKVAQEISTTLRQYVYCAGILSSRQYRKV